METLLYDARIAIRALVKRPGFLTVTVLTFALGVGASTAMFSVVHGVLLSPLGYPEEHRLVAIASSNATESLAARGNFLPDVWYWREHATVFEAVAFHGWRSWTLQEPDHVERLQSVAVSANLFDVLGIEPVLGRSLLPEDEIPGPGNVVLVSHGLWQRVFGGDRSIVGRGIRLHDSIVTIVGVMPPDTNVPSMRAELWRPVGYLADYERSAFGREERDFRAIARLSPGVLVEDARSEMAGLSASLSEAYPTTNAGWAAVVEPLRDHVVGSARLPLWIAFSAVVLVLLLACTNIVNLLFVRAMGREREQAIRTALGAGRRRALQQHVTESLVLTLLGGGVGTLFAIGLTELLLLLEPGILPRKEAVALDGTTFAFAFGASVLIGVVFGIVSALHRVPSLASTLKEGGAVGGSRRQNRMRLVLVGGQVAVALSLLVGAALLGKALHELSNVDPGFRPQQVYSSHIILGGHYRRDLEARRVYFRELVESVRGLPGIEGAAVATTPPVDGMGIRIDVPYRGAAGPLADEADAPRAAFRVIGPGYFEVIGTPMLRGRDVTERDTADSPPVVIINDTLARRAFPNESALGRQLSVHLYGELVQLEVVGVSGDTRFAGLHEPARPALFLPHRQMPFLGMAVVARTTLGPATYRETIRRAVLARDPSHPVLSVDSLEEALAGTLSLERFYSALLALFAAVALALATSGIYGVFSYWVSQRRRELGLRLALGASPLGVMGHVLGKGARVVAMSVLVGTGLALSLSTVLAATFRGVRSADPVIIAGAASLLAAVALGACVVPARQAARVQPTEALRAE